MNPTRKSRGARRLAAYVAHHDETHRGADRTGIHPPRCPGDDGHGEHGRTRTRTWLRQAHAGPARVRAEPPLPADLRDPPPQADPRPHPRPHRLSPPGQAVPPALPVRGTQVRHGEVGTASTRSV